MDFGKKFSKSICKKAVELKLKSQGINTQTRNVARAERYIELYFDEKKINLDELAEHYGLKPTEKIRLGKSKQPALIAQIKNKNRTPLFHASLR